MSLADVANHEECSLHEVFYWMRKYNIPRRSLSEAGYIAHRVKFGKTPCVPKRNLTSKEKGLKIAGIMLYWAEGAKASGKIDLANSDPKMIQLFLEFLRKICRVEESRLRARLYCFANQNPDDLKKYWSRTTKIPLTQFSKSYVRQDYDPKKIGKMRHGLIHVVYSDTKLLLRIKDWIKEYCKNNYA